MANKLKSPLMFRTPQRFLAAAVASCFVASSAVALPTAPTVTNGTASFAQTGSTLTVTNSNGTVINWNTFNIGAGETTRFIQPSASSSVLNRVLANDPSVIYGTLSSNGRVWLVNPAGIFVGPGGRIDAAAFIASTLNVKTEDFLAGKLNFGGNTGAGNVVNQGTITTPSGGSVYLIGPNVSNEGIIQTPQGETILAAGQTVSLVDSSTPGVKVDITGAEGNATNLGQITAEAGRIGIAGVIVRNSGTLNASSVSQEGGRIFLKASRDAYVDKAGRIVTTGTKGGRVEVLGERVAVMDQAQIDASGTNGGGQILIGGDYQGKNPDVQNAQVTFFGPEASLKANATDNGDGGKVIVWADDTTRAYGSIEARGGANGGNGGFVETSGKRYLDVPGIRVDAGTTMGATGQWLLDPADIDIYAGAGSGLTPSAGVFSTGSASGVVYGADIFSALYGGTSVKVDTSGSGGVGNITVNPGIYQFGGGSTASTTLSLYAYGSIAIGQAGQATDFLTAGNLKLISGWTGTADNVTAGYGHTTIIDSQVGALGSVVVKTGGSLDIEYYSRTANPWSISNMGNDMFGGQGGSALAAGTAGMSVTIYGTPVSGGGLFLVNNNNAADQLSGSGMQGRFVGLLSQGSQTITMAGYGNQIFLNAGAAGYGGPVFLMAQGDQKITFEGGGASMLRVWGGSGASSGQRAVIGAGGTQLIDGTSYGGSLAINLTGGSPNAAQNKWYQTDKDGNVVCIDCSAGAEAIIRSESMASNAQTIKATSIVLQGGGVSNGNGAYIESYGESDITATSYIAIYGGMTGGSYSPTYYGGSFYNGTWSPTMYGGIVAGQATAMEGYSSNDAGISSDTKVKITVGNLDLDGKGATTSYAGAYIGGPEIEIQATGVVSVKGGLAPAFDSGLDPNDPSPSGFVFHNPAAIGWDQGIVNINIQADGGMVLDASAGGVGDTGFYFGGSPAIIGGVHGAGAVVEINTGSNPFTMTGGQFATRVGSKTGGLVKIESEHNAGAAISLGDGLIGTGSSGSVQLYAYYGAISQTTYGRVVGSTLDLYGGLGITMPGSNMVGWLTSAETTTGNLYFNSVRPLDTGPLLAGGTGNISITSAEAGYGSTIRAFGTVTAGGWVSLQSDGDVHTYSDVYGGGGVFLYAGVTPTNGSILNGGTSSYGGGSIDVYADITGHAAVEAIRIEARAGSTAGSGQVYVSSASAVYGAGAGGTGSSTAINLIAGNDLDVFGTVTGSAANMNLLAGMHLVNAPPTASGYGGDLYLGSVSSVTNAGGQLVLQADWGSRSYGDIAHHGVMASAYGNLTMAAGRYIDLYGSSRAGGTWAAYGGNSSGGTGTGSGLSATGGDFWMASGTSAYGAAVASIYAYSSNSANSTGRVWLSSVEGGSVSVYADRAIYDNNGLGTTNINAYGAGSVTLASLYGGVSGNLAISADVYGATAIGATVASGSTYGGIRITGNGAAVPGNVNLVDYGVYGALIDYAWLGTQSYNAGTVNFTVPSGDVLFATGGSATGAPNVLAASPTSTVLIGVVGDYTAPTTSSYGLDISVGGTLTVSSLSAPSTTLAATTMYAGSVTATAGDATLVAGTMTLTGNVVASGTATVSTGGALTLSGNTIYGGTATGVSSGSLTTSGSTIGSTTSGSTTVSAGTLTMTGGTIQALGPTTVTAGTLAVYGGTITSTGGAANLTSTGSMYLSNATVSSGAGETVLQSYQDIALYGGTVQGPDVYLGAIGDIRVNSGALVYANANDVLIELVGSGSTFYLNELAGMSPSQIHAYSPSTVTLSFLGRSSGGLVVDGVPIMNPQDLNSLTGSGFYVGSPAVRATTNGGGLELLYAVSSLDICVISPSVCAPPPPATDPVIGGDGGLLPPPPSGGGGLTLLDPSLTTGGEGGNTFGSGDQDDAKKQQSSSQPEDRKQEDKSQKKPVGRCRGA